jgi:hypothetical protein
MKIKPSLIFHTKLQIDENTFVSIQNSKSMRTPSLYKTPNRHKTPNRWKHLRFHTKLQIDENTFFIQNSKSTESLNPFHSKLQIDGKFIQISVHILSTTICRICSCMVVWNWQIIVWDHVRDHGCPVINIHGTEISKWNNKWRVQPKYFQTLCHTCLRHSNFGASNVFSKMVSNREKKTLVSKNIF